MQREQPLVSIIVVTYNSSKYVLETLESAKNQTYQNIELIITDDGSQDNTVEICKDWLSENSISFVRTELITVEKNTGIPANCNRGVKAAQGEWIKFIAGDDELLIDCISNNIDYIKKREIKALQTLSRYYYDSFEEQNYIQSGPVATDFFSQQALEQYEMLMKINYISAPSMFLKKEEIIRLNGFDETFTLLEDITMWMNLTRTGVKIYFHNVETVNYRIHRDSVARQGKANINKVFCKDLIKFIKKYKSPSFFSIKTTKALLKYKLLIFYDDVGLNNNSFISRYIYIITLKLLS